MKLSMYEKLVILRGLTEVKAGKIAQAISNKVDIDTLIKKIQKAG